MTWLIAWPLLAALLLALLARLAAPRAKPRALAVLALAASLPTPALAAIALLSPLQRSLQGSGGGIWLQDRLALSLQLMLAVPLVPTSLWRLLEGEPAGRMWPYWPAAAQLLTAGSLIAVDAAWLFPMLFGLALVAASMSLLLPRHGQAGLLPMALLLTAWLGIACLAGGQGGAAGWAVLQSAVVGIPPVLRRCGVVLLGLPMLLLAWIASAGLAGGRRPGADELSARVLLPVLAGGAALDIVLRLRALPEPGSALLGQSLLRPGVLLPAGGGLLGIALACALMPPQPRQADRLMLAAALQLAAAAVGFGIGGAGGVLAGLLLLGGLVLALPAALLPVPTRLGRVTRRLAVLALAGLPPFLPFAAGLLLLLRLFGAAPSLAVSALAGLAVGCGLLAAARPDPDAPPAARGGLGVAAVPAVLALALLGWLGLAMPPGLSAWLLATAEDMAGAPAPIPVSSP